MDQIEVNESANAMTLHQLIDVAGRDGLDLDAKLFLCSDEEGNAAYGLGELHPEPGRLILIPYNSQSHALYES